MLVPIQHPFPVYYCRHGQTDWNRENRLQGHSDIPLNDKGCEQARAYGLTLRNLKIDWPRVSLFVSPLSRAQETLDLILDEIGGTEISPLTDDRLIELDLGSWNGMTIDDVRREYPEEWDSRRVNPWTSPVPDGESYADAEPRLRAFAMGLTGPSLVVGHGGTGRVLRGLLSHGDPAEFLKHGTRQDRIYVLENGQERCLPVLKG